MKRLFQAYMQLIQSTKCPIFIMTGLYIHITNLYLFYYQFISRFSTTFFYTFFQTFFDILVAALFRC